MKKFSTKNYILKDRRIKNFAAKLKNIIPKKLLRKKQMKILKRNQKSTIHDQHCLQFWWKKRLKITKIRSAKSLKSCE